MRYLKGTADYSPCYQGSHLHLQGYTDADGGEDIDEHKSTSGYVFLLNNNIILWCSKKQICIALSTMEAKFIACSAAMQEAIWFRRFLLHLGMLSNNKRPITVHYIARQ